MRKLMLISLTVLGLAAIGLAITGPASAQTSRTYGAHGHRTNGIVVASRTPSILV
jgi:hypothetical protein